MTCKWSGSTSFSDLESALVSYNFQTGNIGLYAPIPIRLKGLKGIRLINELEVLISISEY